MKQLAGLDDARKVRVMAWCVPGAVLLTGFFAGVGLILNYATLHANGGDVAKATSGSNGEFPMLALWLAFFHLTSGARSGATFRRLTGWFVASLIVVHLTYAGLLAVAGYPIDPAIVQAEANLVAVPLAILAAYWLFRRHRKRAA